MQFISIRNYWLFISLGMGILISACGVKPNESQTMAQVRCGRSYAMDDCLKQVSIVNGTWSLGCLITNPDTEESTQSNLHLDADGTFTETTTNYLGSTNCKNGTAYSAQISSGTFGLTESNITGWTETSRTLTALSEVAVTEFNEQGTCGADGWVLNQAQACPIPAPTLPAPIITFLVNHDLLMIQTCTLHSGKSICTYISRNRVK